MKHMPPQQRLPTRTRVLAAAKTLFSLDGFEKTTTAAIARHAATSESQLIKYFGGKEGLLAATLEQSWEEIGPPFVATSVIREPREKLRVAFELMLQALEADPELAELMLMEGRRGRKGSEHFVMTEGYRRFAASMEAIVRELCQENGVTDVSPHALTSALIGILEGLLRDRMAQQRSGREPVWSLAEIRTIFAFLIPRLFPAL